jgi:hypothetical protein
VHEAIITLLTINLREQSLLDILDHLS